MPVWLVTFFTTHLWKIISVIADLLVVAFVLYSAWNIFHPKPTTTQNQKAQQIYNYTYNIYPDKLKMALGKIGGFELFSYHSYPTNPITVTNSTIIPDVSKLVSSIKK